ncbi:MAG: hypothetical protein WCA84_09810 [Ignavibacteriaceae bacterium]
MKYNIIQLASLFVIAFIFALSVTPPALARDKKGGDEIKSLTNRIAALEKKVNQQDSIITGMRKKLDKINNPEIAIPNIQDLNNLRKGGNRFEFNGQTYYMVPIKDTVDVK